MRKKQWEADGMLFRKKIERRCAYCANAGKLSGEEMICRRHGIVAAADQCGHFRYDPLKRVPARPKPPAFRKYKDSDFSL